MVRGVSLVALTLLLVLNVYAQEVCEVVYDTEVVDTITSFVFTPEGYNPVTSVESSVETIEEPAGNLVTASGDTATTYKLPDEMGKVGEGVTSGIRTEGRFTVVLDVTDTVRVVHGGIKDEKWLRERFEARYEFRDYARALSALTVPIEEFVNEVASMRDPISNVITGEKGFEGGAFCFSDVCRIELYSLLTKYMNIGASSALVMDVGGKLVGGVLNRAFPQYIQSVRQRYAELVTGRLRVSSEEAQDTFNALSRMRTVVRDRTRAILTRLSSEKKEIISKCVEKGTCSPDELKTFSHDERLAVYHALKEIDAIADGEEIKKIDKLVEKWKEMSRKQQQAGSIATPDYKLVEDTRHYIDELPLTQEGGYDAEKIINLLSEKRNEILKDKGVDEYVRLLNLENVPLSNAGRVAEDVARNTPLRVSQFDRMPTIWEEGSRWRNVERVWVTPVVLYAAHKGSNIIPATDAGRYYNRLGALFPIVESIRLPASAQFVKIESAEEGAFVDIFVNGGSDPGDAFKSIINITLGPLADLAERMGFNVRRAASGIFVEDDDLYEVGNAVLVISCEESSSCSLSETEGFSGIGKDIFISLHEKDEEKPTTILFAHKANLKGEGIDIRMDDKENACRNVCPIASNPKLYSFIGSGALTPLLIFFGNVTPVVYVSWLVIGELIVGRTECHTCVDTEGGYFLHVWGNNFEETNITDPVEGILESLVGDENRKGKSTNVQFIVKGYSSFSIEKTRGKYIVSQGPGQSQVVDVDKRTPVMFKGEKDNMVVDGKNGDIVYNGKTVTNVTINLSYPDTRIPGYIIPQNVTKLEGEGLFLEVFGPEDFTVYGDGKECIGDLGRIVEIHTTEGVINVEKMESSKYGEIERVRVYYNLTVEVDDGRDHGKLKAVVGSRGGVVTVDNEMYFLDKDYTKAPAENVDVLEVEEGEVTFDISPKGVALPTEMKDVTIEDVRYVDAENGGIALVRTPDGEWVLRTVDKETSEVTEERVVDIAKDPETGEIIIKTVDEEGNVKEHRVKIEVDPDTGEARLVVDGKDMGTVNVIQGENGFLWYDPTRGEWSFVEGILAPFAEAFKNGMTIKFEDGRSVATPGEELRIRRGVREGLSLPFTGEWIVLLILLAVIAGMIAQRGGDRRA